MARHEQDIQADEPQPLLQPAVIGDLRLPNRVVMAPMTRCRAADDAVRPQSILCIAVTSSNQVVGPVRPVGRRGRAQPQSVMDTSDHLP